MTAPLVPADVDRPEPMRRVDNRRHANPYAAYEAAKRALPPNLTPEQYENACRALARKFRI